MKKRTCPSCGAEFLDDRNTRCPKCDAGAMEHLGADVAARRLAVREAAQRRIAAGDAMPRVTVRDDGDAKRVSVVDLMDMAAPTQRRYTPEGYLVVPARIGRAGNVQEYRARELGLDGGDKIVRLYRPREEVFAPDTLASFIGKPIADDHPPEGVNADNWKEHSVGDVGPVRPDSDYMLSDPFTVRDAEQIAKVRDGKVQLSCGYDFDLDMKPGVTADGQKYDGVQRNIRGNHVAIVDLARGGPGCRIADGKNKEIIMTRVIIKDAVGLSGVVPGAKANVEDQAAADALQDAADRHHKALMDCMAAHDAVKKERDELVTKLKAHELKADKDADEGKKKAGDAAVEIEKLKAQIVTPEQFDARIEERSKLIGDVQKILGEDFDGKGKTNAQIRVAALDHVIARDGAAKNVATAVLGGTEPAKANEKDTKTALDAILGLGDASTSDGGEDPIARSIKDADNVTSRTRDGKGGKKPIGVAAFIERSTSGFYAGNQKHTA